MNAAPLILLADDDPGARLLQTIALEGGGFRVEAVADGEQALALFDVLKPDCLILDVVMPKLTGFDVCRAIRAQPQGQHVPILILTSLDDLESISTAYVAGATDFMQKGINPLLLVERVRFMLRAKQLQDGLVASEARLSQAQELARIGHWTFDADGRTLDVSPVVLDILGLSSHLARSTKAFQHFVHSDDLQRVRDARAQARANRTSISVDFRIVTPTGIERIVHMQGAASQASDREQRKPRVLTIQDITDLRRAEDHARLLAYFDPLSGLPNRAFMKEQLALHLRNADRHGEQILVVALDLEQFNRVNHSLGSVAGDELICAIGARLQTALAADAPNAQWIARQAPVIVARTGGDEFGVMLSPRQGTGHVANALQFLTNLLHAPLQNAGQEVVVGATLGAAVYPDDSSDAETLLRMADTALHQAKESARGGYKFYSARLHEQASRRLSVETDLRRALERDQMELHFQPRLDARTLQPTGMEALLRWRHPDRGLVGPMEFIPIAESVGLIAELGEWVIHKACEHAAILAATGQPLRVAANVSALQLQRADIVRQITGALRASKLEPALFEIEITEGVLIDQPEEARRILAALKAQGIRIALDDFGTGYSSLGYLRTLPIDFIKIDRSFIADLEHDHQSAIVATILTLAKGLRLGTIAEGVETERQMQLLMAAGCTELQGFLFARALSVEELQAWLREQNHRSLERSIRNVG